MIISKAITCVLIIGGVAVSAIPQMKYKVIANVSKNQTAGVIVDDGLFALNVQDQSPLYFIGYAPVAQKSYKYAIIEGDGATIVQQENFTRTPIETDTNNEYYNRTWNAFNVSQIPDILDPLPIINRIDSNLHIDGQIPTIHITGNQTELDYIQSHPFADTVIVMNMTYIGLEDVQTFSNIEFGIAGHSTRAAAKLSYKIKIQKGESLYEYRRFKLRALATDPSYMREKISYDIANKVGFPTTDYSYARLYLNDQPIGLFGFAENYKNPWIQNEFADGDKDYVQGAMYVTDVGGGGLDDDLTQPIDFNSTQSLPPPPPPPSSTVLQGANSSDLSYLGNNITVYEGPYSLKEDPSVGTANYTRIMELTKFISQQPNDTMVDDSAADVWETYMDVESILRVLAHEITVSDSDGYLVMANNYMMYDDLDKERIIFGGQDFDLTMGTVVGGVNASNLTCGDYNEYYGFNQRPLTSRIVKVPKFKARLEELLDLLASKLVNPDILGPRIDDISNMLAEDVEWDLSLTRVAVPFAFLPPDVLDNITSDPSSNPMQSVPFPIAVNGTSENATETSLYANYTSLKDWLENRSSNTFTFFNTA